MPKRKMKLAPPAKPTDPVSRYARAVLDGKILAGRAVRLACERHLKDYARQRTRGFPYYFSPKAAKHIIDFYPAFIRLEDGVTPLTLAPWQKFCLGSCYGWRRVSDDGRKVQRAFISTGKGSGKTPLLAAIGLYCLAFENEQSNEVYSAAFDKGQASILVNDAIRMATDSPDLAAMLDIGKYNIAHIESGSFFRAVSSEHRSKSGPRPGCVLIDEVHEHRDGTVINKMLAGFKSRAQPILIEITNTGSDKTSICWQHNEHSMSVLEGTIADEQWFAYVCQLDPCATCYADGYREPKDGCPDCDDWTDEKVWCLAGTTQLYARIGRGHTVATLHELLTSYRTSDVELWDGRSWVHIQGWSESTDAGSYEMTLRSGEVVKSTAHHEWPTARGRVRTDELCAGDILSTARLPDFDSDRVGGIPNEVGYFLGLYLAEGTQSGGTIHVHGHIKETTARLERIRPIVEMYGGACGIHNYHKSGIVRIESAVLRAIIDEYILGSTARTKSIKNALWRRSNAFLNAFVQGYLDGDGSYESKSDRYRLGFCANAKLASDLRTLGARLGASVRVKPGMANDGTGKRHSIYRGEWRWSHRGANARSGGEIVATRSVTGEQRFYHIGVDNADGLFALASGVLTHNSKTNPSLCIGLPRRSYLQSQVDAAIAMPSDQALVKRLNFCIWTQTHTVWIPPDRWEACRVPTVGDCLDGARAAAFDMSEKLDLTACVVGIKVAAPANEPVETIDITDREGEDTIHRSFEMNFYVDLIPFFWLPEDTLRERVTKERIPFDVWADTCRCGRRTRDHGGLDHAFDPYLRVTPGPVIDYDQIYEEFTKTIGRQYSPSRVGYDPHNATQFAVQLRDKAKYTVVEIMQGRKLSESFKLFEALVRLKRIRHAGNPILSWCVSNSEPQRDRYENLWCSKPSNIKRIDGLIASVMVLNQLMLLPFKATRRKRGAVLIYTRDGVRPAIPTEESHVPA